VRHISLFRTRITFGFSFDDSLVLAVSEPLTHTPFSNSPMTCHTLVNFIVYDNVYYRYSNRTTSISLLFLY